MPGGTPFPKRCANFGNEKEGSWKTDDPMILLASVWGGAEGEGGGRCVGGFGGGPGLQILGDEKFSRSGEGEGDGSGIVACPEEVWESGAGRAGPGEGVGGSPERIGASREEAAASPDDAIERVAGSG